MPLDRGASLPGGVHPKHAFIREDGMRDLSCERLVQPAETGVVLHEFTGEPPAVTIELDAHGAQWLLEILELKAPSDRFTSLLAYACECAKELMWDKAAS